MDMDPSGMIVSSHRVLEILFGNVESNRHHRYRKTTSRTVSSDFIRHIASWEPAMPDSTRRRSLLGCPEDICIRPGSHGTDFARP